MKKCDHHFAAVNQIQLLGRVGRDPEERGSLGSSLVLFPLATNSAYNRQDGNDALSFAAIDP